MGDDVRTATEATSEYVASGVDFGADINGED